jgi:hypothetical protein
MTSPGRSIAQFFTDVEHALDALFKERGQMERDLKIDRDQGIKELDAVAKRLDELHYKRSHAFHGFLVSELDAEIAGEEERRISTKRNVHATHEKLEAVQAEGWHKAGTSLIMQFLREYVSAWGGSELVFAQRAVDIARMLPLSLDLDDMGRPTCANISVGGGDHVQVALLGCANMLNGYRPKDLEWMSGDSGADGRGRDGRSCGDEQFHAFWCEDISRYAVSHIDFRRMGKDCEASDVIVECVSQQVSQLSIDIKTLIQEGLKDVNSKIDLRAHYSSASMPSILRERIEGMANMRPMFQRCKERVTSSAIQESIQHAWRTFVGAPWHGGVNGDLAMLKYLAERGEQAVYWNGPYIGHYGFRMRTRDHTWLVGEIFTGNAGSGPGPSSSDIEVLSQVWDGTIARLGHVWIRVRSSKE